MSRLPAFGGSVLTMDNPERIDAPEAEPDQSRFGGWRRPAYFRIPNALVDRLPQFEPAFIYVVLILYQDYFGFMPGGNGLQIPDIARRTGCSAEGTATAVAYGVEEGWLEEIQPGIFTITPRPGRG